MKTITTPKIYVADLAAYNDGLLKGVWLDATLSADELTDAVKTMLGENEEWAIHDYEGFDGIKIDEWDSFETVSALANAIMEHPYLFSEVYNHLGSEDVDATLEYIRDNYLGSYQSLEEYAEQWLEETGGLNSLHKNLYYYFDFEKFGRDMEINGDIFTIEEGYKNIHVFINI
jgi:antirestriction protein